jgi:hypothetical protein
MAAGSVASVRAHGVQELLVYCLGKRDGDWPCRHSGTLPVDRFRSEETLADIERRCRCTAFRSLSFNATSLRHLKEGLPSRRMTAQPTVSRLPARLGEGGTPVAILIARRCGVPVDRMRQTLLMSWHCNTVFGAVSNTGNNSLEPCCAAAHCRDGCCKQCAACRKK